MKTLKICSIILSTFLISSFAIASDMKVGFIYIGPPGDHGWNYQHDVGRKAVDDAFGGKVETVFQENVPESADAERVMTQMALSGADMIFARFYEGRSVIGHVAGKMTKSNTIGYVASYPIPEVVRGINSAYLAAKAANPNVEFKVIWIFTWYDPAKEADAAKTLIQQGADVIMQHVDSSAIMTVAEEAGVYAFGQASDMSEFGPNAHLTAIINGWAPYYVKRVQQAMDGTWKGGEETFDGIGEGMVIIGKMSDKIPEAVRKEAQDLADGIASGDIHSFTGPINKQDGTPWLAAGETADIGTLLGMNFYVEGIEGDIPQ
jgi:basic membrane protein A